MILTQTTSASRLSLKKYGDIQTVHQSHYYKISKVLEKQQPTEQVGFKKKYSTLVHNYTLDQIIKINH